MLIIGELINSSRKAIKEALEKRDAEYIRQIAKDQVAAGADYVDVNCGTMANEVESMAWLVNTIQEAVEAPLCIDSPNPQAIAAGLALCKFGQPMLNSISDEKERFNTILPLVVKFKTKIVALCMDDTGMPNTAKDRMKVVKSLYAKLTEAGVPENDIYFDPLVKPISAVASAGLEVLETIRAVKKMYPNVHMTCGLSNISYGLPNRNYLNRMFVTQTNTVGMDSYILNPTDKGMMGNIYASQALLGQDSYCMNYLTAYRKGLYE
ncbi:methyltetrahydrofolate cobalamin methyltransferase [Desulfosporosinus sp. PR]|uniref:methyltetrahydrofolate cobalamin methyltransferase n=1 Tax=Candidatus Desulfosporosinus nitrosoreducens TaxID=3401928 RepID=UPI0027EB960B|nr:methyltetrahydrofolate cobalamin methyltransferase [Desulfosporosinus sp. PR]MDQ7095146.1 methyltetrahydrofolate cobalamin methyltransferase [Desulfosporosinus sp. PR]